MNRILTLRVSEAVTLLAFIALCFPTLAMIPLGDRILFPHYLALAIAIPVLFASRPHTLRPVLPVLGFILLSSALNIDTVSIPIAVFHSLHLMAIALLGGAPSGLPLRFAKATIMIYCIVILLTQVLIASGLGGLVEGLLVQREGVSASRVSGFATEPSYAGMIMMILARFVIVTDLGWMNLWRLVLILAALLASMSLFSLIAAMLILAMYSLEHGNTRAMLGILVGGVAMLAGLNSTDFFASRLSLLDLSQGAMGFGTGTVRLLPYIYMFDILPENLWPIFMGAGAGGLEPGFFSEVGQFATAKNHLATHMAGPVYDYGLPVILLILLMWNRPAGLAARALFIVMTLVIMLNTGIGTYLFILFGAYALLEQRLRSA